MQFNERYAYVLFPSNHPDKNIDRKLNCLYGNNMILSEPIRERVTDNNIFSTEWGKKSNNRQSTYGC